MSPGKKRTRNRKDDDDEIDDMEGIDLPDSQQQRATRNDISTITEKLKTFQDNPAGNKELLPEIIELAQQTTRNVKGPQEAHKDNKMFAELVKTVRIACFMTPDTERKFLPSEFAVKLGSKVNAPEAAGNESGYRLRRAQMVLLGERYGNCFQRAPTMKFILGTLNTEIGERRPEKRKTNRPREKVVPATKTAIVGKSQATEAKTDRFVKITKRCLDQEFTRNKKKPICYFTFVIDPDDFAKTVENMFHVSFLVKQRAALLFVGENGLPHLEPVRGGDEGEDGEPRTHQAVISICLSDWEQLKTNLNITKRAIDLLD